MRLLAAIAAFVVIAAAADAPALTDAQRIELLELNVKAERARAKAAEAIANAMRAAAERDAAFAAASAKFQELAKICGKGTLGDDGKCVEKK